MCVCVHASTCFRTEGETLPRSFIYFIFFRRPFSSALLRAGGRSVTARVTGSRRDVCVGDLGGVVARTRAPVWATSPLPPLTLSVRSRGRRVGPACRPPARTEELWRTCIGSVADLLLACLPRCCLESRGRAARMLREGFFVSFFFFCPFLIVSFCCHVLLFFFTGVSLQRRGEQNKSLFQA